MFPGAVQRATEGGPRKPLSSMAMMMVLHRLSADAVVHGFRSSFRVGPPRTASRLRSRRRRLATWSAARVTWAYARSDLLEVRRPTMEAWARYVSGEDADSNVVTLPRLPIRAA